MVEKGFLTQQALVAANRELIARFEKKIQATLARVWGESEKPAPTNADTEQDAVLIG